MVTAISLATGNYNFYLPAPVEVNLARCLVLVWGQRHRLFRHCKTYLPQDELTRMSRFGENLKALHYHAVSESSCSGGQLHVTV